MLLYAASMDGQGAIAMQAARDYDKMERDSVYPILTLIRFGRFDEILEMKNRPEQRDRPPSGISVKVTRVCGKAKRTSHART